MVYLLHQPYLIAQVCKVPIFHLHIINQHLALHQVVKPKQNADDCSEQGSERGVVLITWSERGVVQGSERGVMLIK